MRQIYLRGPLTPERAGTLGLWPHRADHHVVSGFKVPFENCSDLGIRMIRDPDGHFDRLERIIGVQSPHHCVI